MEKYDHCDSWSPGFVTAVKQLQVTGDANDPMVEGYEYDEVRRLARPTVGGGLGPAGGFSAVALRQVALALRMHATQVAPLVRQLRAQAQRRSQLLQRPTAAASLLRYWARHESLCGGMHDRLLDLDAALTRQLAAVAEECQPARLATALAELRVALPEADLPPPPPPLATAAWAAVPGPADAEGRDELARIGGPTAFELLLRRRCGNPAPSY